MKKYKQIYKDHFDLGDQDRIRCEHCKTAEAVDIHHIEPKGMGGSKTKDHIENLIGLCRTCHKRAHGTILPAISKETLFNIIQSR